MRTLYIIRHGEVAFPDGKKRCIGRTDIPLSEAGKRHAEKLRAYFLEHPIEAVYASPLQRAEETAQILAGGRIPCRGKEGLTELYMGEWENLPLAEIKKELETEPLTGEKRSDGVKRFTACIQEIMGETAGDVAVVAHAGINCCYLSQFLDISLERSRALAQPYCGLSRFFWAPDGKVQVEELGRQPLDSPDVEECEAIWDKYHTPDRVRAHCMAVCREAEALADKLASKRHTVRRDILTAAALLHDVARQREDHPLEGAKAVIREGYPFLAPLILCHHDWERRLTADQIPGGLIPDFRFPLEAKALYLADKYIRGTDRVSLEERFAESAARCAGSEEAERNHARRYQEAQKIEDYIGGLMK